MSTESLTASGRRTSLTRGRIIECALRYIDDNGLNTLSMHKLGAVLDVKGMSLYHHVANKDDLLDGVVEALWEEIGRKMNESSPFVPLFQPSALIVSDPTVSNLVASPLYGVEWRELG